MNDASLRVSYIITLIMDIGIEIETGVDMDIDVDDSDIAITDTCHRYYTY